MTHNPHMLNFRNAGRGPEEVDVLLRSFFRAEMPEPWPTLKAPAEQNFRQATRPVARCWTSARSRMALAASITLLVLGSWCFSAKTPEYALPTSTGTGTGSGSLDRPYFSGPKGTPAKATEPKKKSCSACGCCGE